MEIPAEPIIEVQQNKSVCYEAIADRTHTDWFVRTYDAMFCMYNPMRMDSLSETQKKEFGIRMRGLREKYKNRQRKKRKLINPVTTSQYDDTYFEILAWVDSLAGEPFSEGEYIVEFSETDL